MPQWISQDIKFRITAKDGIVLWSSTSEQQQKRTKKWQKIWGTCAHLENLLSSANSENRKKEIASQAAWHETTGQSPYCLNTQHCAEPFCTFLLTESKIGLKDQGRSCKRGFIELHYILKGLVAPARKESQSVQTNRQEAPALLHCFLGRIWRAPEAVGASRFTAEERESHLLVQENTAKVLLWLVAKESC